MNKKYLTTHKIVKQEIQTLSIETSLQDAESQQRQTISKGYNEYKFTIDTKRYVTVLNYGNLSTN